MKYFRYFFLCLSFVFLSFYTTWANQQSDRSLQDQLKLGIDFGFGFPYEWGAKAVNDKDPNKASGNINLGLILGYDFDWYTLYKNYKWGPELGISYGFTRKLQQSKDEHLEEKYLHLPISMKFMRFDDDEQPDGSHFYFGMGGSLGYEFNILVSSIYKNGSITNKLHPSSQPIKDSDGYTLDVPKLTGSIVGSVFIYGGRSIYVGVKIRIPIEAFQKSGIEGPGLSQASLRKARIDTNPFAEIYIGFDILKWF